VTYSAGTDPYCYKGSAVLKNIPGIRDPKALEAFETVSAAQRADEPLPDGALGIRHYRAVHRHLFQDVYRWAGKFRSVRLSKGRSMFCYPENIATEMRGLFAGFRKRDFLQGLAADRFATEAAAFLAELNAVHAFREGNGRSQLAFLSLVAERAGHPMDMRKLRPKLFLAAMVESFDGDGSRLRNELLRLIG
jgi:cell filamentation protein